MLGIVVTFHAVCLGWIFFRAANVEHALQIIGRIAVLSTDVVPARGWLLVGTCAVLHGLESLALRHGTWSLRLQSAPAPLRGLAYFAATCLLLLYALPRHEFIYFQF